MSPFDSEPLTARQLEVTVLEGDLGWDRWNELVARQEKRFAPTMPAPIALRADVSAAVATAPADTAPTVDEVLLMTRRNGRVCPLPREWRAIFEKLADKPDRLARPLVGKEWQLTSSLAKRLVLRDQIEWAASAGLLGELRDMLAQLPEENWLHMGQ
ncbi:hypothetical protein [Caenimonas koreensis]|uniref:Uncharacterized protein n=1 Tax=Caenimonas koreensis DSM 17982 TaxID=1121255 RepID=A0A844AXZ9_9BURK|nr:hypothetical protein [Caenimonas koreensis]MRD48914.1 hypothetical protein [Caenimonas koreensis DSM 17982]